MNLKSAHPGPRYDALLHLLRTAENLWNGSRLFFAHWDLSPSQFNILNLLSDSPEGITQIELSRLLIMHRSNATGLIDRLEERGLLQRKASPDDRRAYHVVLTPAGKKLIAKILPEYYRVAEEIWGDLPINRANELVQDLETLNQNVEKISRKLANGK